MRLKIIWLVLVSMPANGTEAMPLQKLLSIAYEHNLGIKEAHYSVEAENSLVTSQAGLDDPMIGLSNLNRGTQTQYATIAQKIRFPTKYYLQAKAQKSRARGLESQLNLKRLKVRQRVTTLYYAIHSVQKIIQLTKANMESVREFARVAEKKYAAGRTSQGDSMKAHFELTQLELELIRLQQEEESLQDRLKAVVNQPMDKFDFSRITLSPPQFHNDKIKDSLEEIHQDLSSESPRLQLELHKLKEVEHLQSLSKWEYAPDFQFQYQKRISGEPEDSEIFSVGLSFPLWFWNKNAKVSAAYHRRMAQEYRLRNIGENLVANVKNLRGKVNMNAKTLKIFVTSLIPQAQGAYNSSRSAYQANRTSFLDLLDSERSLYRVKTGYYQSLRQYVANLTELESQLGYSVSSLEPLNGVKSEK